MLYKYNSTRIFCIKNANSCKYINKKNIYIYDINNILLYL